MEVVCGSFIPATLKPLVLAICQVSKLTRLANSCGDLREDSNEVFESKDTFI